MSKCVTIAFPPEARKVITKAIGGSRPCYYLSDDYSFFFDLRKRFRDKIEIRNLSSMFDQTFQEIRQPFLEKFSAICKQLNSHEWWSSQTASRNPASTPLLLNITYLFCARKILSRSENPILIIKNRPLAKAVASLAESSGYKVEIRRMFYRDVLGTSRHWLYYVGRIGLFLLRSIRRRVAAFQILKPLPIENGNKRRRVLIRTWITQDTFHKDKGFIDRNFGTLPSWLLSKDYEIWTLPMYFNLSLEIRELYKLICDQKLPFLIPDLYLRISDYLFVIHLAYRLIRTRIQRIEIQHIDVTDFFREVLKEEGFHVSLLEVNLCYPLLRRLRKKGCDFHAFFYPFEGNSPEKLFILACRTFFPRTKILGFQHTTFFPNQLAYHLAPGESEFHPLPDEIICSGPIYKKLFLRAGFPSSLLRDGTNLRFVSVHNKGSARPPDLGNGRKVFFVPLPGTPLPNYAYELLDKLNATLRDREEGFEILLRNHPVLKKSIVEKILQQIGMTRYHFADEGEIQDWLPKSYAMFTIGTSITAVEAASMGVPVIRIMPDNTFYFDPLIWPDYPLKPAHTPVEIKAQLDLLDQLLSADKTLFSRMGQQIRREFFTEPTEQSLKAFLV